MGEYAPRGRAKDYVIWGSGGHAKVLIDLLGLTGGRVIGLFDNAPVGSVIRGLSVNVGPTGLAEWKSRNPSQKTASALVAVGGARGRERLQIQALLEENGFDVPTIVHPQAHVSRSAIIGQGVQVLGLASVAADVKIGDGVILNHGASVDHDCVIGDGVHIAPKATLCGVVTVGDGAFIGAGSVILPRLRVGKNATVGAGAVVTRSVPDGATVVGNPATSLERDLR